MRRSSRLGEKPTNPVKEVQQPKAMKSRSDVKIPNIALDNVTMVEAYKFLNYYQLSTSSLATKRFRNLIQTHRHSLAFLDVVFICMNRYSSVHEADVIKILNKKLSAEEYNEFVARNGYSKQIPLEGQIAGKENTENVRDIYQFRADVSRTPNHGQATTVLYAQAELKDENWPVFQHFFRLLMDPSIYIRTLDLNPRKALSFLTRAMNPDRKRLQCKKLKINFNGDTQEFIAWIKEHVRCDVEFGIYGSSDYDSNYDEKLLDFFMTGARCATSIYVRRYDISKVFDLVQKFMALKNLDEYRLVESIWGNVKGQGDVGALKRNCAEFIAEEEKYDQQHEWGRSTTHVIGFINNDIEKKLSLTVENCSFALDSFSIKITNL